MKEYNQEWLRELDAAIEQNLSNSNFKLEDLVRILVISPAQLYRRVIKLTGKSPRRYIRFKRLTKAKELLERGVYPTIKEVALSVGFLHVDYFSRVYEQEFGKRPISYLKNEQKN